MDGWTHERTIDELRAERDKLLLQIQALQKNDYTDDSCAVCKMRIREKEARCEDRGVWYHHVCKIVSERDNALRLISRYQKALEEIAAVDPRYPDGDAMSDEMCAKIALGRNCYACGSTLPCREHKEQQTEKRKHVPCDKQFSVDEHYYSHCGLAVGHDGPCSRG